MANDNRSTCQVKDDGSSKVRNKVLNGEGTGSRFLASGGTDTSGLRSARETSSRKQMAENPSNMCMSEGLKKRMPNTSEAKKISEIAEIQTTTSPSRRSDRGKQHSSPSSPGSKKLGEGSALSDMKGMREKHKIVSKQLTEEPSKVIRNEPQGRELGVRKRKSMNALVFKALYKAQRTKITEAEIYEVGKPDQLSQIDSTSDGGSGSKSLEEKDHGGGQYSERQGTELLEECVERASEGPIGIVGSDLKSLDVVLDVEASNLRRKLLHTEGDDGTADKDCTRASEYGTAEGTLNVTAAVQVDNSQMVSEPPKMIGSTSAGKSPDGGYDSISYASKFVEYWVPVQISNMQLEQYCATLLSNAMALCSCSKNDPVVALRDVLVSSLKCCDHPYIVDPLLQSSVTKDHPPSEYLDIGIKASCKLQLLDIMLTELKKKQLRVLIIFQPISGTGKEPISIGDILDDFVRQRFGQDSYERVDGGVIVATKRQAALRNFNNDKRRFIFLLEHRACLPSIKLSSVDTIIIFDSDLNPMNDLRALQKITIDSQLQQINIFRLYVCCTVEERVLLTANQDLPRDSKLQNLNRSTSETLLMWGASYLFSKLDEFHSSSISTIASEQSEVNNVLAEILEIISQKCQSKDTTYSAITRVELSGGSYCKNSTLHNKLRLQLQERQQPYIFWRKLLDGRNPQWKYLSVSTPRQRKRIHYSEESPRKTELGKEDGSKRQKKMVVKCPDPASVNPVSVEGTSGVPAIFLTQSSPTEKLRSTEVQQETAVAVKSHYSLLKLDVSRLCQLLKLSEEISAMIGRFFNYIFQNHRVSREPAPILQAFLISVCWIGASLLKHKIDKKESLSLAKKHMDFSCTEEEAISVYSKLKRLKEMFFSNTHTSLEPDSSNDSLRASDCIVREPLDLSISCSASDSLRRVKLENEGQQSQYPIEKSFRPKQGQSALEDRNQVRNKIENQMLAVKQQMEFEELNIKWENKKIELQNRHRVQSALRRALYSNLSVRLDKLKALDNEFAKEMNEHKRQRDIDLENLKAMHLAEARQMTGHCLEEAKLSTSDSRAQNELTSGSPSRKQVERSKACDYGTQSGPQNVLRSPGHLMQRQSLDEVADNMHLSKVVVADIPEPSSNVIVRCNMHTKEMTIQVPDSGNDKVEAMASEEGPATTILHPSEGGCSRDGADNIISTSAYMENQIQLPAECETAPNEVLECLDSENMRTPPIVVNNEKSGAYASGHDMMNAGGMQNDGTPCSNSGNSPACNRQSPPSADLDFQDDCSQPLLSGRVQDDAYVNDSASPQVDSPLQPVVTGQCDQPNANGQVEEPPPVGVHSMLSVNAHHSQSQPNSLLVSGNVDVQSVAGQIISDTSSKLRQLAEEFTDASDNITLRGGENLEAHPPTDAELPITENQAECYAGDTLDHRTVGVLENQLQNVESLPQAVHSNTQFPSLSGAQLPIVDKQAGCNAGDTLYHRTVGVLENQSQNVEALPQAVQSNTQIPSLSCAQLPISENQAECYAGDTLDHRTVGVLENQSQIVEALPQAVQSNTQIPSSSVAELPIADNQAGCNAGDTLDHQTVGVLENQSQIVEALPQALQSTTQIPSLSRAELPIVENQAECYAGDTLDHQTVGVLEDPSQNVESLPQAVQSTTQIPSVSSAELPIPSVSGDTLDHQTVERLESQSQDVEGLQQVVQATTSIPSSSGLHTGADVPIVHGSQVLSQMTPAASNSADPLQIELDRLRTEMEHVFKVHEDTKLRLKSECDKEIAELAAQIRSKYESKRLDLETEYLVKRKELDAYHNKVHMNKVLADAFRSKCFDLRPSGAIGLQQAMPSSFMQQLRQLSIQTAPRPAPVVPSVTPPNTSTAQRPAPVVSSVTPPNTTTAQRPAPVVPSVTPPNTTTAQRPAPVVPSVTPPNTTTAQRPAPVVPSVTRPNTTRAPPLQIVSNSAALFSSSSSTRPPNINPITPSPGNLRVRGEIRAPAPHIQPFRPSTSHFSQHAQGSLPASSLPAPLSSSRPQSPGLHSQHTPNPLSVANLATVGASSQQRSRSSSPSANLSGIPSLQRSGSLPRKSPSFPQLSSPPPPPPPPPLTNQSSLRNQDTSSTFPIVSSSLPRVSSQQPSPAVASATSFLSKPQSAPPPLPPLPPLVENPSGLYNKPPQLQNAGESSSNPNNLNTSSTVGLLRETVNEVVRIQPNSLPPLCDFGSNFESLDLSSFGTTVVEEPVISSAPSTVAAIDVVCLSDDDE